jgi:hypothetical protein
MDNLESVDSADSIDSFAPGELTLTSFVYAAASPAAPFPPRLHPGHGFDRQRNGALSRLCVD